MLDQPLERGLRVQRRRPADETAQRRQYLREDVHEIQGELGHGDGQSMESAVGHKCNGANQIGGEVVHVLG